MTTTFAPRRVADALAPPPEPDEPLVLPDAWSAPARPPIPLVASAVPVVGAVVLWLVTNSPLALILAALGPLIAVAGMLDARRGARRDRRRAEQTAARARDRVAAAVARRHDEERRDRHARHPDAAGFLRRTDEIWRRAPEREGRLVVGAGVVASTVRVTGGRDDADSDELRARALRLEDAPLPIDLAGGVAIVGPAVVAAAVHRALVLQVCLGLPPGEVRLVGTPPAGETWIETLPHRRVTRGMRVAVASEPALDCDTVIALVAPGDPVPPTCRSLLLVESPGAATLDHDGRRHRVRVEAFGRGQAEIVADLLSDRAEHTLGLVPEGDAAASFSEVLADGPSPVPGSLVTLLGSGRGDAAVVDLVADGPHAVVAGVTGSGKSELLITWILGLAARYSTGDVSFLLADFKGGTAFDALRPLPHVTGIITDLDGAGAHRAISSLRAEVRWRETELARHGARDILDERVRMPRLVVVVDEFAALLGEHPELQAVFIDLAARGRALGIHLILGTQRVPGVVRDSLLANCPLRVSLRVGDPGDSRAVLGTDDAAHLPGDAGSRGIALVRRPADAAPRRIRVALSDAADVAAVALSSTGELPRRPWLPALPSSLPLDDVLRALGPGDADLRVLGLADEPDHQRQRAVGLRGGDRGMLVVGGPGAGKTTALEVIAAQSATVVRMPVDGEALWDMLADLSASPPPAGALIAIDDLDTLTSRLSADHAVVAIERLESLIRTAGDTGILVVAAAQRLVGPVARLADLLPKRLVLGLPTRADHLALAGDADGYDPDAPPGRGRFGRTAVQVALPPARRPVPVVDPAPWTPRAALTGLVTRRRAAVAGALAEWAERGIRSLTLDEYAADTSAVAEGPLVLVGDPDAWQREWRLLASVRADHDLVVDTSCAAEYRVLAAARELPPFARSGCGRAWLLSAGGDPVRIVLPGAHVRPERRREDS